MLYFIGLHKFQISSNVGVAPQYVYGQNRITIIMEVKRKAGILIQEQSAGQEIICNEGNDHPNDCHPGL